MKYASHLEMSCKVGESNKQIGVCQLLQLTRENACIFNDVEGKMDSKMAWRSWWKEMLLSI